MCEGACVRTHVLVCVHAWARACARARVCARVCACACLCVHARARARVATRQSLGSSASPPSQAAGNWKHHPTTSGAALTGLGTRLLEGADLR